MPDTDWYEVSEGPKLAQGDVLFACPVFLPDKEMHWPIPADSQLAIRVRLLDLVVVTQSCDLENDKVTDVLLAELISWPDIVRIELARGNTLIKSKEFRKKLIEGGVPGLSLFHRRDGTPSLPWSVVDFHNLFALPKGFACQVAAAAGPRLRLRSPYREHLAQAFARYFMRVGLPHDAKAFEKEGEVKV